MNVYLPNLRLPSAYQEVEWIQNSSSGYINTGYVPTANTKIKGKFNVTSVTHTDGMSLRGLMDSSNVRYCSWYFNNGNYGFGFGTLNGSGNAQYAAATGTQFEVENYASNGTAYNIVNGVSKTETGYTYSGTTYTMYLFTRHRPDSELRGTVKIYYFKIYENGTLVRDFVPCYRKSDNVIGLYDLVNNQFYTNAGTGTFSKGNDVTMADLKNVYIGGVYKYSYDFTKGSISDLTNQGWTGLSKCSINTTYGLTSSTSWDTPLLSQPKLTSVLSSAKKIYIAYTWYKGVTGNYTQRGFGFRTDIINNVWVYGDGSAIQLTIGGTLYLNTTSSQSVGTYNFSLEIDLENKSAVYSGITSGTYTITDSDISTIRKGHILRLLVSSNSYIKNVSILVE